MYVDYCTKQRRYLLPNREPSRSTQQCRILLGLMTKWPMGAIHAKQAAEQHIYIVTFSTGEASSVINFRSSSKSSPFLIVIQC